MDENKDKQLAEISYKVHRTCGQCKHFKPGHGDFGTCNLFKYKHLKHTGEERQLSVNRYGSCSKFEMNPAALMMLGLYDKYLK